MHRRVTEDSDPLVESQLRQLLEIIVPLVAEHVVVSQHQRLHIQMPQQILPYELASTEFCQPLSEMHQRHLLHTAFLQQGNTLVGSG